MCDHSVCSSLYYTASLHVFLSPSPIFISAFFLYKKSIGFCSKCASKFWQGPHIIWVLLVRFYTFLLIALCIKEKFVPSQILLKASFLVKRKPFLFLMFTLVGAYLCLSCYKFLQTLQMIQLPIENNRDKIETILLN